MQWNFLSAFVGAELQGFSRMPRMKMTRKAALVGLGAASTVSFAGLNVFADRTTEGSCLRFKLSNRRYIGCKQKLLDWIFEQIHTKAPGSESLFDVFSGTGVVAERALGIFKKVIVNDLLYSNQIIYEGFFGDGDAQEEKLIRLVREYNELDTTEIDDNWFSDNYGGKYFEKSLAKLIGYIRQSIEDRRGELTNKERSVLLASLIYSIDSHANTCGHFEAYIKKPIPKRDFKFGLIEYGSFSSVEIYRQDSNALASKVEADVAYIDPPYNSRQYSRFYHVYETLVKWDKPTLHGEARKPDPENMSDYCRNSALTVFTNLIRRLRCRYLFVSYNNTYSSKSKSSENKISLEQLRSALEKIGRTSVFAHKHSFYNAGKTSFNDHREYLFVTEKISRGNGYLRSPFFYVGDKYKLLPSIVPLFPKEIDRFVEPFVGGGSVFMNVPAKKYLLNDIDKNMIDLHRHLCKQSKRGEEWFSELDALMVHYGLSRSYREDVVPDELKKGNAKTYFARFNKGGFLKLRADYNASDRVGKGALDRLYLLLIFGFNRMLRYNSRGDFNLPVGNVDFNANVEDAIRDYFSCVLEGDIRFTSMEFEKFLSGLALTKRDFVYCDPPYLITESEYNKIWHEEDDCRLMAALDHLNEQGLRFAVSNVTHYRGRINERFLAWSHKYRTVSVKSNYINYHDNSEKLINEVLVVNY